MSDTNKKKRYQRYNEALISKIDSMELSAEETNPYAATKKEYVSNKELYDEELYSDPDEKEGSGNAAIFIAIVVIGIALMIGVAAFAFLR